MITVLVYGRNDSYGYNLHKRAAISLNTFGALLDDPDDEIVFVDYNTPDDFPTFPEAIRDTLTPQTRARLRVLRARPSVHRSRTTAGAVNVVEPIARNIGVRRSNPANRWILSTNTDIIVGLREEGSFKDLLRGLEGGFYQAPRVEIPETIWESFDRSRPDDILRAMRRLPPSLHLDEIVYGNDGILFDGPGDFQLAEREALFAIDAFHEGMDKGWHVDSNLSVRMAIRCGEIRSLESKLFAYHCDHTRQVTPLHKPESGQNDSAKFVDNVRSAEIPEQRGSWGAPDEPVEEIRIDEDGCDRYFSALKSAIGEPQNAPIHAAYRHDSYDQTDYDPRHILPFLADLVSSAPRDLRFGWVGFRSETLERFLVVWRDLGFTQPIRLLGAESRPGLPWSAYTLEDWLEDCDIFAFDFGEQQRGRPLGRDQRGSLGRALHSLRQSENDRSRVGLSPRRIVGISVVHNRYERAFASAVAAAATPFSTRIRVGFARPAGQRIDWLALGHADRSGVRAETKGLSPGRHYLHWHLKPPASCAGEASVAVKVDGLQVAAWTADCAHIAENPLRLPFDVDHSDQVVTVEVAGERFEPEAHQSLWSGPEGSSLLGTIDLPESMIGNDRDWLPFTSVGTAGIRVEGGVAAKKTGRGHVIYGPYWSLPPGRYVAHFDLDGTGTNWGRAIMSRRPLLRLEVRTSSGERLGRRFVVPAVGSRRISIPFLVADWHIGFPLELRLFTGGASGFVIRKLTVDRAPHASGPRASKKRAEVGTQGHFATAQSIAE